MFIIRPLCVCMFANVRNIHPKKLKTFCSRTRMSRQKKTWQRLPFDSFLTHRVFASLCCSQLGFLTSRVGQLTCGWLLPTVRSHLGDFIGFCCLISASCCKKWTDWSTVYKSVNNMSGNLLIEYDDCIKGPTFSMFYPLICRLPSTFASHCRCTTHGLFIQSDLCMSWAP